MNLTELRNGAHLSVSVRTQDPALARIRDTIEHVVMVDGRSELEASLNLLAGAYTIARPSHKTLDLIGHATADRGLLELGDFVIDGESRVTRAFFRELADHEVFERLGVRAVRLLGCATATTEAGRATLVALADIIGLPVYGTSASLSEAHYDREGLRDVCAHLLVSDDDVRRAPGAPAHAGGQRRMFDVDALSAGPLAPHDHPWPRRIATAELARDLVRLIRRGEGAEMPGLVGPPICTVALPASRPGWYHRVDVMLDGAFVRVRLAPGDALVAFPVSDPAALTALIDRLAR